MDSFRANRVPAPASAPQSAGSQESILLSKVKETETLLVVLIKQRKNSPDDIVGAQSLLSDVRTSMQSAKQYFRNCSDDIKFTHQKTLENLQTKVRDVETEITGRNSASLFAGSDGVDLRSQGTREPTMEAGQQSLANALAHSAQAMQTGMGTISTLQGQTEQISRTHKQVANINEQLDHSEYLLRGIKSLGGAFTNLFRPTPQAPTPVSARSPSTQRQPNMHPSSGSQSARDSTPTTTTSSSNPWSSGSNISQSSSTNNQQDRKALFNTSRDTPSTTASSAGGYGNNNNNNNSEDAEMLRMQQHKQVVDQGLDQLHTHLKALKGMGMAINTELDQQNKMLDALDRDVDKTNARVEKQTKEIRKIL